jgi:hypothetical protein
MGHILQLLFGEKNTENSATAKAIEKIGTDLESYEFYDSLNVCLTKFKNNQILLNKCNTEFFRQPSWVKDPQCNFGLPSIVYIIFFIKHSSLLYIHMFN